MIGARLAYTVAQQAFLFDFENGIQVLDVQTLGLNEESWLSHPSFSPAGDLIAWAYYSPTENGRFAENSGIVITTAAGSMVYAIEGYQMWGLDGGFEPPAWSHDSSFLAFQGSAFDEPLFGTFVLNVQTNIVEASFNGYYPIFTGQSIIVQDFDRSPTAMVARGMNGQYGTHVDLMQISRARPAPLEDVGNNTIYLDDDAGQVWVVDQHSMRTTRVDLPVGTRLIGWVER